MKTNIKNILVPFDLSETALNAVNTAIQMAKRHDAVLHILYIQDLMDYYPGMGQLIHTAPMMQEVWENDRLLLEKMVIGIRYSHHVNCHLHIETGNRAATTAELSARLDIDITVLGTEPYLDERNYLTDSLPYRILKQAQSHVLVVPANKEVNSFSKIIFPVLGSEHPAVKLSLSECLIERNNAEVLVLDLVGKSDLNLLSYLNVFSERIQTKLNKVAVSVNRRSVYTLNVVKELISIAQKQSAHLVVLEADTRRNIKEFFFGNFTQRMLRNPEVAVLFVRSLPEKADSNDTGIISRNADVLQLSY